MAAVLMRDFLGIGTEGVMIGVAIEAALRGVIGVDIATEVPARREGRAGDLTAISRIDDPIERAGILGGVAIIISSPGGTIHGMVAGEDATLVGMGRGIDARIKIIVAAIGGTISKGATIVGGAITLAEMAMDAITMGAIITVETAESEIIMVAAMIDPTAIAHLIAATLKDGILHGIREIATIRRGSRNRHGITVIEDSAIAMATKVATLELHPLANALGKILFQASMARNNFRMVPRSSLTI